MRRAVPVLLLLTIAASLAGYEHTRLLRPGVLKQLAPDLVPLIDTSPDLDRSNKAVVALLIGYGGLLGAEEEADGVFRARVLVPPGPIIWKPAAVLVRRGGELELDFRNGDPHSLHSAILPSICDPQVITVPGHTAGRARLRLHQPGVCSFGCPIANHAVGNGRARSGERTVPGGGQTRSATAAEALTMRAH